MDCNNHMQVVGHDPECVDGHVWKVSLDLCPKVIGNLPKFTQLHFLIHHRAQQAFSTVYADGDKIESRLRIIVTGQPD